MVIELGPGVADRLAEMGDINLVLTTPGDGDRAARALSSAARDLYWLDTPPDEDGEWLIPSMVTEPRVLGPDVAFVYIDAGDADPDLLTRIPGIVERHLTAVGGSKGMLTCPVDLPMDAGEPFVPNPVDALVPEPERPSTALRPPIPPRPAGAAALEGMYWDLDKFLDPADAAVFAARELVPPLLHAAGLPTPRFLAAVAEAAADADWIDRVRSLHPEIDDVLVRLPVYHPMRPDSRDPLIWSGIDAAFDAVQYLSHAPGRLLTPHTLHHHGNAPAATAVALQYALFDEATDFLNRVGFRTWGAWIGKAAETLTVDGGEQARWRAEAGTQRVVVSEVTRWLAEDSAPLLTEGRRGLIDVAGLVRGAAHAATSMLMSGERDAARRRAGGAAALALLNEIGRRAAGEISARGTDPYAPLAGLGAQLAAATAEVVKRGASAERGDRG